MEDGAFGTNRSEPHTLHPHCCIFRARSIQPQEVVLEPEEGLSSDYFL